MCLPNILPEKLFRLQDVDIEKLKKLIIQSILTAVKIENLTNVLAVAI